MGIIKGQGASSVDRAKRQEQIDKRDKEDKKIEDAAKDGDVDDLNDMLGWDKE